MNTINVFAYGSLKRGKFNHGILDSATYLGEYYTNKDFTLYVDGLPYLTRTPGMGCSGELYKVSPKLLKRLDMLEGHPEFYCREVIAVYDTEVGNMVEAWCYLHPDVFNKRTYVGRSF